MNDMKNINDIRDCFDGTRRNRQPMSYSDKRNMAEIVFRHGHRGLDFTVKVLKDYGLIAKCTYYLDCSHVRRSIRILNGHE